MRYGLTDEVSEGDYLVIEMLRIKREYDIEEEGEAEENEIERKMIKKVESLYSDH